MHTIQRCPCAYLCWTASTLAMLLHSRAATTSPQQRRLLPIRCSATSSGVFVRAHDGRKAVDATNLLLPAGCLPRPRPRAAPATDLPQLRLLPAAAVVLP